MALTPQFVAKGRPASCTFGVAPAAAADLRAAVAVAVRAAAAFARAAAEGCFAPRAGALRADAVVGFGAPVWPVVPACRSAVEAARASPVAGTDPAPKASSGCAAPSRRTTSEAAIAPTM